LKNAVENTQSLQYDGWNEIGHIKSVLCRFCISFGREGKVDARYEAKGTPKIFTKPLNGWRTDAFINHLKDQHASKYETYNCLLHLALIERNNAKSDSKNMEDMPHNLALSNFFQLTVEHIFNSHS